MVSCHLRNIKGDKDRQTYLKTLAITVIIVNIITNMLLGPVL